MFIHLKRKCCLLYLGLEFLVCEGTVGPDVAPYKSPDLILLHPEAGG